MATDQHVALFCLLHPATVEKRDSVIHLLQNSYDYRDPAAQTTTWCYFTPSTRPKALRQTVDNATAIAGMEVYTEKAALKRQLSHPGFKHYHEVVKNEDLYAQPEELTAWYPTAGFLAREKTAPGGVIVMTAMFHLKSGGDREKILKVFSTFAEWVKVNEPGVLTYSIMTRPKAPEEILFFERYDSLEALGRHGSTGQFKAMFSNVKSLLAKGPELNEWSELRSSFVGNVVGGSENSNAPPSKL